MVTPRAFLVMKPGECEAVWYLATGVRIPDGKQKVLYSKQ
jgi:hypothetical protein